LGGHSNVPRGTLRGLGSFKQIVREEDPAAPLRYAARLNSPKSAA
jgi:hypothetical protein